MSVSFPTKKVIIHSVTSRLKILYKGAHELLAHFFSASEKGGFETRESDTDKNLALDYTMCAFSTL